MKKKKMTITLNLDNPLDAEVYEKLKVQGYQMTDYVRYLVINDLRKKTPSGEDVMQDIKPNDANRESKKMQPQKKKNTLPNEENGENIKNIDLDQEILLKGLSMFENI